MAHDRHQSEQVQLCQLLALRPLFREREYVDLVGALRESLAAERAQVDGSLALRRCAQLLLLRARRAAQNCQHLAIFLIHTRPSK